MSDLIWIKGRASTVTEKAVFVQVHEVDGVPFTMPSSQDIPFPKSLMKDGDDPGCMDWGDEVEFGIPERLAEDKELI